MKINSSDNKIFTFDRSQKDEAILGIDGGNKLGVGAQGGFLSKISSLFEKIKTFMDSPEEKELREKKERELAKENFINSQSTYLFEGKIDELIDKRKEFGLRIPAAAYDYESYVRGREENEPFDKTALINRAKESIRNQIFAESNDADSYIDYLYIEGKADDYADRADAMQDLYEGMTQDEYNEWRDKAEKGLDSLMRRMNKLLSENKDYTPDTLTSVLNYRLYNVLKSWTNKEELRNKIERDFADDILGNALAPLSVENFSEFSTALQALGILSPNNQFISKNVAEIDIYQQGYESHSEMAKRRELVFEIAKDKELLREGKFDELLKKDYGEFVNEQIINLQALKVNPDSDKKMYQNQLEKVLGNFSEYSIISFLGGDIKKKKIASSEKYNNYVKEIHETINTLFEMELGKLSIDVVGNSLKRKIDNFNEFRKDKGLPLIDENFFASKTISEISKELTVLFKNERSFGISDEEKGEKLREYTNEIFLLKGSRHGYEEFILKKLNSDFDKLYEEANKQKDLGSADKKALILFEDIKKGLVDASNETKEIKKRFSKEIKNYDKIEWQANPFATTILQAVGFLNEELYLSDGTDEFKSFRSSIKDLKDNPYSLTNKIKNDGLKEKNKVIDINPDFVKSVANGKRNDFIKATMDILKDKLPEGKNKTEIKKLVQEVLDKGAQKVIEEENLDGRTKEARFIKEIDKKIKEVGELSM